MQYGIYASSHDTTRNALPIRWRDEDSKVEFDSVEVPKCLLDAILAKNDGSYFTKQGGETKRAAFHRTVLANVHAVIAGEHECGTLDEEYTDPADWKVVVLPSEPDDDKWKPVSRDYAHPLFKDEVVVAREDEDQTYEACRIYYNALMPVVRVEDEASAEHGTAGVTILLEATADHATAGVASSTSASSSRGSIWVRFAMEEVAPLDMRVTPGRPLTRVAYDTWAFELSPEDDPASARFLVEWVDPHNPVRVAEALYVERDEPLREMSLLEDYRSVRSGLQDQLRQRPAPAEQELLWARLCWIAIDLATSLDQVVSAEIVNELGLEARLYARLDARRIEEVRGALESRWRARAAIVAAVERPSALLPPVGQLRFVAQDVAACILAVVRIFYPGGVVRFWRPAMLWACGRLRGRNSIKFNSEPNSAAIASFAELFDVAGDDDSTLPDSERADCRLLHLIFTSILEPYFEIYRASEPWPRQADFYKRGNLSPARRDPRWEDRRIEQHLKRYDVPLRFLEQNRAWIEFSWGQGLLEGLRDEARVKAAARAPGQVRT